jgi:hypothetical protein
MYRAMIPDSTGRPQIGSGPSMLGARVPTDIRPDALGSVQPGMGGISVTPDDPAGLPPHFRPPHLGGFGALPLYCLSASDLGGHLAFRPDQKKPNRHGFIEPAREMMIGDYQLALAGTQPDWSEVK